MEAVKRFKYGEKKQRERQENGHSLKKLANRCKQQSESEV